MAQITHPLGFQDLEDRLTVTVEEAASLLSLGRTAAYEAARRGEIPTRRLGRRLIVPVPALLALALCRRDQVNGRHDMKGHIHKRVHSTADGRTTTTWYVVVDAGRKADGKRRQKWHGGFRTRKEARGPPRPRSSTI
jgi:excisionase family DNA binding protein